MRLPQPYLFTSERMYTPVDSPYMSPFPSEGLMTKHDYGYHTLWAAEVPFVPAERDREARDFSTAAAKRVAQTLQRQMRFLSGLVRMQENLTTFEFRLISWPQAGRPTRVSLVFLGKTFHPDEATSRQLALSLWERFCALFPADAPFFYPLVPVQYLDKAVTAETHSFQECFEPLSWQSLTRPQSIVEIRKYEDWPTMRNIGGTLHIGDYIPTPFQPADDYSALTNLLITMARQQQICMAAITLRPQTLTTQEVSILHELADLYRRRAEGEVSLPNPARAALSKFRNEAVEAYMRPRAARGQQVYENLAREHRNLFLARIQVVGQPEAQDEVVEALGAALTTNVEDTSSGHWVRVQPQPEELRWARSNLQWLEFARWGLSSLVRQDRRFLRLRQLTTVREAVGVFCLPIAPSERRLEGVEVRDEPFPACVLPGPAGGVTLGVVLNRGVPTDLACVLPREMLAETLVFLGKPGTSRARILERLLEGERAMNWPWIHITTGTRREMALQTKLWPQRMLIDGTSPTLERATPFCHPLIPPPNCPLSRFQDALLQVLGSILGLPQSVGIVLRPALREAYRLAGWTDEHAGEAITPAHLAEQIEIQMRSQSLPQEINTLLLTHCVLPLRDLADTAAWLFQSQASGWTPTGAWLVEVGWVGSDLSNRLVRGCLWAWFALALPALSAETALPRALLSLDEAHLFFPQVASSYTSSLVSLLVQQTAQGCGTLLFSDRSSLLSSELDERAVLTLLSEQDHTGIAEYLTRLPGLASPQRRRLAHLRAGEIALVARNSEVTLALLS